MDFIPALEKEVFLVVDQLLANSRGIGEGDDRVDHFASIGTRLVGRDPPIEHFGAQIFILLCPRTSLLRRALVFGAHFIRVGDETEGASLGRPVASEAEDDRGLVSAIQSGE